MNQQVFQKVTENLQRQIQTMQMTQQQADMLQQQQIQMIQQHTQNEILVNMVKMITTELLKIKDKLEESKKYF